MILYIQNPKESTKKLLELINEFGKVAGYKIHIHKSVAFLYANNEQTEREIKKTTLFTTTLKRIKYLGINQMKDVKWQRRPKKRKQYTGGKMLSWEGTSILA